MIGILISLRGDSMSHAKPKTLDNISLICCNTQLKVSIIVTCKNELCIH